MKAILDFKRMILMGLMLFVSVGLFADSVNEENIAIKNTSDYNLNIAPLESGSYGMEIIEGAIGYITIVPPVGYTTSKPEVIEGGDNIGMDYNSRGLVIRFIAKKNGQTKLKVTLLAIGGGSKSIEIDITINIKSKMDKS